MLTTVACSDAVETASENNLDVRPPTTEASYNSGTYVAPIAVSLSCSDDKSGCNTYYSIDSNQEEEEFLKYNYEPEEFISITKTTTLRFYSIDFAGRIEDKLTRKYIIDYAPVVTDSILNFTISNGIMSIEWNPASDLEPDPDRATPQANLTYQLYYADTNVFTSIQNTLNEASATAYFNDWQESLNAQIDPQTNIDTRNVYWQVLVKDASANYTPYTPAQYPADTVTINQTTISSILHPDLVTANQLDGGQLAAYSSVDNGERQLMTLSGTTASATLQNLLAKNHSFLITYEFTLNNHPTSPLLVAQTNISQDFSNGLTPFEISDDNLNLSFDTDNDGSTNIQEILTGTNPHSLIWIWVSGDNTPNSTGNYGSTTGETNTAIAPGARYGAATWVDSTNHLWLFGGYGFDANGTFYYLNDLWRWDGNNWMWISGNKTVNSSGVYGATPGVVDAANVPGARQDAVSWIDSNNQLWLFGGYGFGANNDFGYLNDLWRWDGSNWIWASGEKTANSPGVYSSTPGVVSSASVPGARQNAVTWIDSNNQHWLFGGFGLDGTIPDGGALNDLWRWDGNNWTWISGGKTVNSQGTYSATPGVVDTSSVPRARWDAASWVDNNNQLWLFGGFNTFSSTGGAMNDLWRFEP